MNKHTAYDLKQMQSLPLEAKLRTTGANRTGCIFCMFGAHLERPNAFERLKKTHPQLWEYCMKPWDDGGLGLKEVCDFCGIRTGYEEETK